MRLIKKLGGWLDRAPGARLFDPRDDAASGAARDRKLGLCFRQRGAHRVRAAGGHRHSPRHPLCAFRGEAWNSLQTLNHQVTLGWFIRALHGWGSNFMVAIVLIHMVQVFLFGAYKFPRELTWIAGVFLLLLTLGMAFSGQVLRFDQDAYWGLGIGASICSRVPVIGPWAVTLLLGGPIIAGATLSRFFAFHVFVVPGLLIAFVGLHLLLVLKLGINEWPMPGRVVRRATYMAEYHELTRRDGIPFVPGAVVKDLFFSGFVLLCIAVCAAWLGPFGPSGQPDPTIIQTAPRPDYFFLWLYAVLSLLPPSMETPVLLIGPAIGLIVLLTLPFVSGKAKELEAAAHCSAHNSASGSRARDVHSPGPLGAVESGDGCVERRARSRPYLKGRSALERQGALVFQVKQCHNCHALGGVGGQRGPELDRIAVALTEDQLIRQVIQGGGNMPAMEKT